MVRRHEFGLSDREKEQLLKSIDDVVVDLQTKTDEITQDIEEVKETKWVIGHLASDYSDTLHNKTIYDKDGSGVAQGRVRQLIKSNTQNPKGWEYYELLEIRKS